jgi:hypothetical protein
VYINVVLLRIPSAFWWQSLVVCILARPSDSHSRGCRLSFSASSAGCTIASASNVCGRSSNIGSGGSLVRFDLFFCFFRLCAVVPSSSARSSAAAVRASSSASASSLAHTPGNHAHIFRSLLLDRTICNCAVETYLRLDVLGMMLSLRSPKGSPKGNVVEKQIESCVLGVAEE